MRRPSSVVSNGGIHQKTEITYKWTIDGNRNQTVGEMLNWKSY